MVIHSKEMATVKYIGHTDFAPGIWVGLELRNQKGKFIGHTDFAPGSGLGLNSETRGVRSTTATRTSTPAFGSGSSSDPER